MNEHIKLKCNKPQKKYCEMTDEEKKRKKAQIRKYQLSAKGKVTLKKHNQQHNSNPAVIEKRREYQKNIYRNSLITCPKCLKSHSRIPSHAKKHRCSVVMNP
jgi:hypothetical protein